MNEFTILVCLFILAMLLVNTLISMWVKNDYFVRYGKKNNLLLFLAIMLGGPVTLSFYLIIRIHGTTVLCLHCGKVKLETEPICYHCGTNDDKDMNPTPQNSKNQILRELRHKHLIRNTAAQQEFLIPSEKLPAKQHGEGQTIGPYNELNMVNRSIHQLHEKKKQQEGVLDFEDVDHLGKLVLEQSKIKKEIHEEAYELMKKIKAGIDKLNQKNENASGLSPKEADLHNRLTQEYDKIELNLIELKNG